ncbi:hypothetical protein I4U23_006027 [Adineta vaga]|nr:hypothetical protein I4U23_006027 [Adineta vaga]
MYHTNDTNNTKFVLDRINQVEKYLGSICVQFGKVCRKEAGLRDCNDAFVQNIFEFADRERLNTSLRESLQQYAGYLSAVEDYRNTLISRIEIQILEPLAKYGEIMKFKRQAVQKAIAARDKGVQRQRKLQQTTDRNPGNRDAILAMEVNAEHAQTEASRADNVVQDEIDKFEEMKLTDIKKYFTDFTLINLTFHARAMEMYTLAHQQLMNINVLHDLEEFRNAAPFHRLHPSQRSVSELALSDPRRQGTNSLGGGVRTGSLSALPAAHRNPDFGSHHSLPVDTNPYKTGSHRSHSTHSPSHNSSSTHGHSSKHKTTSKTPTGKIDDAESYSSDSSSSN